MLCVFSHMQKQWDKNPAVMRTGSLWEVGEEQWKLGYLTVQESGETAKHFASLCNLSQC